MVSFPQRSDELRVPEPETPQPGLECDNFKSRLKRGNFKCMSWLNGSFFEGDDLGFLKE
jgi:hypothetical protein